MCLSCGCQQQINDHQDSRNITLLDLRGAAEAAGVSVQEAASNITKTVAQAVGKGRAVTTVGTVIKSDDSQRFLLTVAYPAWKPDVAIGADGHIDVATDKIVEHACWNFMKKGARVGMWHEPGHEGAARVVENYIWRGDPWVMKAADGTEQVVMPGDWLVGLILDERPWQLYKAGIIGGVSVQGGAKRKQPSPETIERVRSRMSNGK